MSNQNDPNNVILNPTGASKLNISISNSNNDYNNTKIGMVKVNYTDNTSYTLPAFSKEKLTDTSYQISFTIYVPKAISSIDIMSNDGAMVYQTITPTGLEIDKFYRMTQDVKIV